MSTKLLICMDTSYSMRGDRIVEATKGCKHLISELSGQDLDVQLLKFKDFGSPVLEQWIPQVHISKTDKLYAVLQKDNYALPGNWFRGDTPLTDAMWEVESLHTRRETDGLLVLFTDGESNSNTRSKATGKQAVEKLRSRGWKTIYLGATENAEKEAKELGFPAETTAYVDPNAKIERSLKYVSENILKFLKSRDSKDLSFTTDQLSDLSSKFVLEEEPHSCASASPPAPKPFKKTKTPLTKAKPTPTSSPRYFKVVKKCMISGRLYHGGETLLLNQRSLSARLQNLGYLTPISEPPIPSELPKDKGKPKGKGRSFVKLRCPTCKQTFWKQKNQTHLVKTERKYTFCKASCSHLRPPLYKLPKKQEAIEEKRKSEIV